MYPQTMYPSMMYYPPMYSPMAYQYPQVERSFRNKNTRKLAEKKPKKYSVKPTVVGIVNLLYFLFFQFKN